MEKLRDVRSVGVVFLRYEKGWDLRNREIGFC